MFEESLKKQRNKKRVKSDGLLSKYFPALSIGIDGSGDAI
jgi:hypothetical protein